MFTSKTSPLTLKIPEGGIGTRFVMDKELSRSGFARKLLIELAALLSRRRHIVVM
jgi:hypothetical protein